MSNESSTKNLKRVLGFGELLSTAIGQIIGAGIMTLMGSAIGMTGRSVPISFLIAAVIVICCNIPMIILAGTVRVRGGKYTMVAMLAGEQMSGAFTILHIMNNVSLGMYGISFANYFIPFFGVGTTKVVAIAMLTIFFVINLAGVDVMAKFQNLIVILMCIALGLFAALGIAKVDPGYMTQDFMLNGIGGLLKAGGLLTFAVGGSTVITNLSGEAKNPTRDIPLAMIISTLLVAVLYAFVSIVAAGVLPVSEVANEPLNLVAEFVLSKPFYAFFMVCGAMFALISTVNAQYAWAPKPILQACDDGWLPKGLAYLHPRFKTPVVLLAILYGLAVVCIISGLDISILGNISLIADCMIYLLINTFLGKLPKVAPDAWNASKFKCSKGVLYIIITLATIAALINLYLNAAQLSVPLLIGNVIVIALSFVFAYVRMKSGQVHVDTSYENS